MNPQSAPSNSQLPSNYHTQYGGNFATPPINTATKEELPPPPAYLDAISGPPSYPSTQNTNVQYTLPGAQQQFMQYGPPGATLYPSGTVIQIQQPRVANLKCCRCDKGFYLNPATTASLVICPHCGTRQARNNNINRYVYWLIASGLILIALCVVLVIVTDGIFYWLSGSVFGIMLIIRGCMYACIPRAKMITPTA